MSTRIASLTRTATLALVCTLASSASADIFPGSVPTEPEEQRALGAEAIAVLEATLDAVSKRACPAREQLLSLQRVALDAFADIESGTEDGVLLTQLVHLSAQRSLTMVSFPALWGGPDVSC